MIASFLSHRLLRPGPTPTLRAVARAVARTVANAVVWAGAFAAVFGAAPVALGTSLPPILRLSYKLPGKPLKSVDFAIFTDRGNACYSYLFRVFGQRSWQVGWRNFAPYGELDFKASAAAGRGHYLIAKDRGSTSKEPGQGAAATTGLYLAHHSGAAFGDKLIISQGRIPILHASHLFCGEATHSSSSSSSAMALWQNSAQHKPATVTLRLIGSRHKVVRYPYLPALSDGKAKSLTIKAARKAAQSMAATFDLPHPGELRLATYRRQGELIQVNYTVTFSDRPRDLVLIGAYTNGIFATQHLHFSK